MKRSISLLRTLVLALLVAGPAFAAEQVDINKADAATLDRVLVNIGEAKAQAIVEHREANGPFRSPEQLAEVRGIGLKTVESNRDRIVLGAVSAAPKGKTSTPTRAPSKPVARSTAKPDPKGKG